MTLSKAARSQAVESFRAQFNLSAEEIGAIAPYINTDKNVRLLQMIQSTLQAVYQGAADPAGEASRHLRAKPFTVTQQPVLDLLSRGDLARAESIVASPMFSERHVS